MLCQNKSKGRALCYFYDAYNRVYNFFVQLDKIDKFRQKDLAQKLILILM